MSDTPTSPRRRRRRRRHAHDDPSLSVQPVALQDEMERSFLDYAMSVIMSRALPDVRDGLKPVHRRIIWDMDEQGFRPDRPFVEVGPRQRRHHGQVPPARRRRHLRRAGAHGPAVLAAPPADRLPRQLRLARLRPGCFALHGVPSAPVGDAAARRHRRRDRRHEPDLRRQPRGAGGAAGALPQPARQRQPGHRRRHGHQHPAAQPRRGHRRHHPPASTTPRPRADDLMQFVKGPDFPTGGSILGRAGIIDAYRTGRGSIKMRATAAIEETKRGGYRSWSPSCRTRPAARPSPGASKSWSTAATSTASPTSTTAPPVARPAWSSR